MSAFDRLKTPPVTESKSKIQAWIDTLPEADRELVMSAVADRAWKHTDLTVALIELGMPKLSDKTFGEWRRHNGWTPA